MNRRQRTAAYEREKQLLFANNELRLQVARLEAELSIALGLMFDSQIADFQEECENNLDIGDSPTDKKAE